MAQQQNYLTIPAVQKIMLAILSKAMKCSDECEY